MTPPHPDPAERLDRFDLLASGIAGRSLDVAPAAPGERSWTDGTTVFLDAAGRAPDLLAALALQASLIAAGSIEPGLLRRLAGRPALTRRYLAVEGHRALAANRYLLPSGVRSLIDPGIAASVDSPAASLAAALGPRAVADPPPHFGTINPKRLLASHDRRLAESVSAAKDVRRGSRYQDWHEPDEEADQQLGRLPQPFANTVGGQGALARLFRRALGLHRERGAGLTGAEVPRSARLAGATARSTTLVRGAGSVGEFGVVPHRGVSYPEWDVRRQRYRPNWCTVTEIDPRPGDAAPVPATGATVLRRPLARLGLGLDRCHRQPQGDELDIDAAVEARVAALAGLPSDEAVYVDSLRRRHDLAILVMLDISGSAAMPSRSGGTVHERQRAAAAALTVALHGLGNRVALCGFYSQGRSAVRVVRVKGFDDALDPRVMRRLGALVPGAYTRLGAAIRHGTSILENRGGTPRRLLVVLSDGLAYDHGYESPYADADAWHALAEARRQGTGCLCLSIGAGTEPAALRRVFGSAAHATLGRPEDLVRVVGPLFREALRSAESQRRTARRGPRPRRRPEISGRTA